MERRAQAAGHPISRSWLSEYENDRVKGLPDEDTVAALAAALDVSIDEIRAAAMEKVPAPRPLDGRRSQHAEAFLRLTDGRTDREIEHLLGVVAATLRAMSASSDNSR